MIDAHCHLDFAAFEDDRAERVQKARLAGVRGFVVAGYGPQQWPDQERVQDEHPEARAALGLHPWWVSRCSEAEIEQAVDMLAERASFAIGEMGLDRSRRCPPESLAVQQRAFRAQLALARDRELPIIIHSVRAHDAVLQILSRDGLPLAGGMVHGLTASAEVAQRFVALGLHVSFSASLERLKSERAARLVTAVPAERLLVETDCPDQVPLARRPCERNLPEWLPDVIATVARLRRQSPDDVGALTMHNAQRLFGFPAAWA